MPISQITPDIKNHFEPVFKYATVGTVVTNGSGEIIAANPFVLKEFGYTENELIGRQVEILMPARYHPSHRSYHKDFITETQTRKMGAGRDLYAIKKDGTEIPVEISLSSYDHKGEKYIISFITNISVRKKAEHKAKMKLIKKNISLFKEGCTNREIGYILHRTEVYLLRIS